MKKKYIISIHILFWMIFIFNQINQENSLSEAFTSPLIYSIVFVNVLTFYFNYFFILPKIVAKKKLSYLILGLFSAFLFFLTLRYFIEEILFPIFIGYGNYFNGTSLSHYVFDNLYWGSNVVFISSLIWFLNYSFKIANENQKLLKEKNHAQLQALKTQINPHFIFNTLNNIYSLVNQKSDKSLMAIEKLSDLLRISGREISKDFINLKTEILYIESLIELESLRISKPENISFEDKTDQKHLEIAPMILVPFVENAFKHGNLKDFPLKISIKNEQNKLFFYQKNKIEICQKDKSSGIGIENVRKRLSILYPEKFDLKITEEEGFYIVELTVIL